MDLPVLYVVSFAAERKLLRAIAASGDRIMSVDEIRFGKHRGLRISEWVWAIDRLEQPDPNDPEDVERWLVTERESVPEDVRRELDVLVAMSGA